MKRFNNNKKITTTQIIAIIISFQIIAIFSCVFLLYSSGSKYNTFFDSESDKFDKFQKWTAASNQNFIHLFDVLQTNDVNHLDSVYAGWLQVAEKNNEFISFLEKNAHIEVQNDPLFQSLIDSRKVYSDNVEKLMQIKKTTPQAGNAFFFSELKPSFLAFQSKLGDYVNHYKVSVIDYKNEIFKTSKISLWGILFIGFLPFIALLVIIVSSFIFLVRLLQKFDLVYHK